MNAVINPHLSAPILQGLTLVAAPGHEKSLELALPYLASIASAIHRFHHSPLISEFLDTVRLRFLRENEYAPKTAYMLTHHSEKKHGRKPKKFRRV